MYWKRPYSNQGVLGSDYLEILVEKRLKHLQKKVEALIKSRIFSV